MSRLASSLALDWPLRRGGGKQASRRRERRALSSSERVAGGLAGEAEERRRSLAEDLGRGFFLGDGGGEGPEARDEVRADRDWASQ